MKGGISIKNKFMCSGCGLCVIECERVHGLGKMRFENRKPIFCMQCEEAPCKSACRVDAIKIKEGIPIIDTERCVGCKMCREACPIRCIFFRDLTAHKCALCLDSDLLIPACIEACPNRLLTIYP